MVNACLALSFKCQIVFQNGGPAMSESPSCSGSLPAPGTVSDFYFNHSERYVMLSHQCLICISLWLIISHREFSFSVSFFVSFAHVLPSCLHVSFFKSFAHVLTVLFVFLIVESLKFFIYSGYEALVRYFAGIRLLPIFSFSYSVFYRVNVLNLDASPLTDFF